jgi:hypothetical protein
MSIKFFHLAGTRKTLASLADIRRIIVYRVYNPLEVSRGLVDTCGLPRS